MNYGATHNAVCFEDLKTAALYFDSVIPVAFSSMHGRGEGKDVLFKLPEDIPGEVLVHLLFGVFPTSSAEKWTLLGRYIDSWDAFIKALRPARAKYPNNYEDVKLAYLRNAALGEQATVRDEFQNLAAALGKQYSTVLVPAAIEIEDSSTYACLVLGDVPLVDAARLSWEQVLELRKDPEARAPLRNLRLFFFTNYEGKPPSFVADDLARRLDEYSSTRKRLGFEAVIGSISALIDAKAVQSAMAMGIAAGLAGGPLIGVTSAALLEVSGAVLEFTKKRFAIKDFEQNHSLAYLIQVKELGR